MKKKEKMKKKSVLRLVFVACASAQHPHEDCGELLWRLIHS
jgi:hypothetical protein